MTALLGLVPAPYRWLGLALLAVTVWGHGWLQGVNHGEEKLDDFAADVRDEGVKAQAMADARAATERARKVESDAKYKTASANLRATTERLRKYADTPGYIVPRTAADTGVVETRACFDQRAVDDAIRAFATGTANLIGEGEEMRLRLDNAIQWAR